MAADRPCKLREAVVDQLDDDAVAKATIISTAIYEQAANRSDYFKLIKEKVKKIKIYKSLFLPKPGLHNPDKCSPFI